MGVETALLAATVTSTVLGAGAAIYSGQQQKKMADYQADQAQDDADAAAASARVQAEKIRKAGAAQAAQANAGYAASGVETGEGTALRVTSGITGDAEEDAMTTILNGQDTAARYRAQAQADRINGSNEATASYIKAGSSLLAGGAKAYSGWKKANPDSVDTGASSNNMFSNMGVK